MMIKRNIDVAWMAGLFEGEGYITLIKPTRCRPALRIGINMTDKDVLVRCKALVPGSRLNGPYLHKGKKPIWHWIIDRREIMVPFLQNILPYLGKRRRRRAERALRWMANNPQPQRRVHSQRFHLGEARRLYEERGLSLREVGRRFGYSMIHVQRKFIAAGIAIRPNRPRAITINGFFRRRETTNRLGLRNVV